MNLHGYTAIALCVIAAGLFATCKSKVAPPANESVDERHNRLYKEACALIDPYMMLHGVKSQDASSRRGRRDLSRGIENLKIVVQINPGNWVAFWIMGKAYQAQGMSNEACNAFAEAYSLQKQNADVAREYMFESLNVGRTKEAVDLARAALRLRPDDPDLKANLALTLLVDTQLDEATKMAMEALQIAPADEVTKNVKRIIEEVRSGKRPQPRKYSDLKGIGQ